MIPLRPTPLPPRRRTPSPPPPRLRYLPDVRRRQLEDHRPGDALYRSLLIQAWRRDLENGVPVKDVMADVIAFSQDEALLAVERDLLSLIFTSEQASQLRDAVAKRRMKLSARRRKLYEKVITHEREAVQRKAR